MAEQLAQWIGNHPIGMFWLIVVTMAFVFLGSKTMELHYKANRLPMPRIRFGGGNPKDGVPNYAHIIPKAAGEITSAYRILNYWFMALTYTMLSLLIALGAIYKIYSPVARLSVQ